MALWLIAGLTVGLLALHMIRPRFERRIISAARFFAALPPARKGMPRLRFSSPVGSRPLYLQLPLMLLVLAALWSSRAAFTDEEVLGFGVWLVIDRSSSMVTADGDGTRLDKALAEARLVMKEAQRQAGGLPICFRLSSFDQRMDHLAETTDTTLLTTSLNNIRARALGTDLNLIRGLRASLGNQAGGDCTITHLVVISDMPAPDWVADDSTVRTLWRHVGTPVSNVGFTHINGVRDPLTGVIRAVDVTVTSYGSSPGFTRVQVTDPNGVRVLDESPKWNTEGRFSTSFIPKTRGIYDLALSGNDAYAPDNRAAVRVGANSGNIRVDWRLNNNALVNRLGWQLTSDKPHMRVASLPVIDDTVPTLYVGGGYQGGSPAEISDFYEAGPLLRDLSLDVAETLKAPGQILPEGFSAVLRRTDGTVLLAERRNPPAVVVPGLPTIGSDSQANFATTAFFNGVKWLLGEREVSPLYELTTPDDPEPGGTRLALHPDEGDTARRGRQFGDLSGIEPVPIQGESVPIWPMLLAAAVVLFASERILGVYGGGQWR